MAEANQPTGETSVDFNRMNPYGPGALADETRQAQMTNSNDAPTDVNFNAVVARSQSLSVDFGGKSWLSNSDRRDKVADIIMAEWGKAPASILAAK